MASKVLLVEDDNNLREIYQARLQAEGYDIVSAKDGEEALVIAKQEQPDLIISDVMMPRVSGFEMLDILRNTEGLKDPKVIMLTALGQADDKIRADQLGADRYLVKSQVTLEDIVKAAQDLLTGGTASAAAPVVAEEAPAAAVATPAPASVSTPDTPTAATPPVAPLAPATPEPVAPAVVAPVADAPEPAAPEEPQPAAIEPVPPIEPPAVPAPDPEPAAPAVVPPPEPEPEPASEPSTPVADAPIEPDATPEPTLPGTEPVVTEPVEASPSEASDPNDQLMADALKDLTSAANSPTEEVTTETPVIEPPVSPAADLNPVESTAPVPEPEPATTTSNDPAGGDSSPVAHKKVIRPIPGSAENPKPPDINELLAKEEAASNADGTVPASPEAPATPPAPPIQAEHAVQPHPPGHVISPTPSTTETPTASTAAPAVAITSSPAPDMPAAPAETPSAPEGGIDPNSIAL